MTNPSLGCVLHHLRQAATPLAEQRSDSELLHAFISRRDEAAFAALVRRYAALVLRVCRHVLGHEQDAEDAFQATFLVLARQASSIHKQASLASFLHGVAYRLSLRAKRDAARRRLHESHAPPRTGGDNGAELAWREVQALVEEELARLPEKYRTPFVLCHLQGLGRAEAARVLGVKEGTVWSRLTQARRRLQIRLARRGVVLSAALAALALSDESCRASARRLVAAALRTARGASTPARVAALANTTWPPLSAGKLKLALTGLALLLTMAGAGGAIRLAFTPSAEEPATKAVVESKRPEVPRARVDRHGDPLPTGAIARLGTVRWRHGFFVAALAFSPDGMKIAAIGAGRDLTLWDVKSGKEIRQFPNESKQPIGVAFSPDGKLLATAGRRDVVSIWNVDTGKLVRQVKCQKTGLSGLVFSPDGKTLAVGDSGGTIYFWDPITGAEQRRIESKQGYLYTLAFSPDGKLLASGGSRGTGDNDGSVLLWDPHTGREERQLQIHTKEVNKIAFSPDGSLLASSGWEDAIRLWDPATGRQIRVLTEKLSPAGRIAFSPDSTLLAVGHPDGTIRLWDTANGKEKRRWETGSLRIFTLAFSPDGKTLASATGLASDIRLWDVATGREKHPSEEHRGFVGSLRFSPDGKELISIGGSDRWLLRWNLTAKTPRRQLLGSGEVADPFALSPDGNMLAVGARYPPNSGLRLWDARTGKLVRVLDARQKNVWSLAFSPDGRLLASGQRESNGIDIWDISNGKKVRQIKGFATQVEWLCFSPDSKSLACGMTRRGKPTKEPTLRMWDVASGKERCSFDCHVFTEGPLAFSPDGKILASGHGSPGDPPRQESIVRLWDATTGKELLRHTGPGNTIDSVAFSPDGKLIASGCSGKIKGDNSVRVWEAATGRLIRHFEGHHSGVDSLAFAPDGLTVASGGGDSTILLWDITGRRPDGHWHTRLLTPPEQDACWTDLAREDAARAYDAVWRLIAAPEQAVPFLQKHLSPVPRPDEKRVERLIADLHSEEFKVRQRATDELAALGEAIAPALRQALAGKPELEARRRVQQLLDQTGDWNAERLRDHRAIQALEHIGTKPARALLEALAAGAPAVRRTEEAKAELRRLASR